MLLSVDTASAVPLFEQLAVGIRSEVMAGGLAAGERLPAARDLADSLEINIHTVLRAYQVLRDEGFIELRRGRGAIVTVRSHDYEQLAADIARVVAEAKRLDITAGALSAMIRKAY